MELQLKHNAVGCKLVDLRVSFHHNSLTTNSKRLDGPFSYQSHLLKPLKML